MSKRLHSYVGLAVLLVVSFIILNWIYGYVLVYQSETNDGFFMYGREFLLEFLDHPGGPLCYAGRFLAQFYHVRWLGALIVSAGITCFGFVFCHVLCKLKRTARLSQALFPCILLLALHTSTIYMIYDTLGLTASCGAFLGYLCVGGKLWRRIFALVATPILYLVLGFYGWFFVAWVVVFEWLDSPLRSDLVFKIFYVIYGVAVPLAAWRWFFLISLQSALWCPVRLGAPFRAGSPPFTQLGLQLVVDGFLVVLLCACLLLLPFEGRSSSGARVAKPRGSVPGRNRVVLAVALPVLTLMLVVLRYDSGLATYVAWRQLYKQERWDALLERAKENRAADIHLQFMTNFALYKKGRLLDEMFKYPQPWGSRGLLFNFSGQRDLADDSSRAMYNCDLYYEMGLTNAAFRHAYDYMANFRMTYEVQRRMAQCSMVNGNYGMAAKYLNMLERTTFHKGFARRYRAMIGDPAAMEREFGELRKRAPIVETDIAFQPPTAPLVTLLESKPDNRMAFEYLMAWFLLDKASIAVIPAHLDRFKIAGYGSIPTPCQEALWLLEKSRGVDVDWGSFRHDKATERRVAEFLHDMRRLEGRPDGPAQLRARYGGTYLYYYVGQVQQSMTDRRLGGTLREE